MTAVPMTIEEMKTAIEAPSPAQASASSQTAAHPRNIRFLSIQNMQSTRQASCAITLNYNSISVPT